MPALTATTSPFGRLIRDHRTGRGLNQDELAALCQVSQATISRWEKGAQLPETDAMVVLHQELGISWDDYGQEAKRRRRRDRRRRVGKADVATLSEPSSPSDANPGMRRHLRSVGVAGSPGRVASRLPVEQRRAAA